MCSCVRCKRSLIIECWFVACVRCALLLRMGVLRCAAKKELEIAKGALDEMKAAWDKDLLAKNRFRGQISQLNDVVAAARDVEVTERTRREKVRPSARAHVCTICLGT